jgi:hypothetical protein
MSEPAFMKLESISTAFFMDLFRHSVFALAYEMATESH